MFDYSASDNGFRPHDLVFADADALTGPTPAWALHAVAEGAPLVVRRAPRNARGVPVGVRGASRGERHGDRVAAHAIARRHAPEAIAQARAWCSHARRRDVPAIAALDVAADVLDSTRWPWGVTGAVGYELATGHPAAHARSDLDLLLRASEPIDRAQARALQTALAAAPARCDVQIETPVGGMALADWASTARQVLIKSDTGPFLCTDPWDATSPAGVGAPEACAGARG